MILIILLLLLSMGVSVAVSLAITSIGYLVFKGESFFFIMLIQRLFSGFDRFTMIAIPMFILCGDILFEGKISKKLVLFVQSLFGGFKGSLASVTTISCMLFGAISGSGPATASAIGSVVAPEMEKDGYDRAFTASVIATSGPLGILIPPSILLIVYGAATDTSIAKLFMGGIGAGVLFGLALMIYQYFVCKKMNYGTVERFNISNVFIAFKKAIWALGAPIIILGGIYGGIFTPTEAGVVAVIYSLFVAMFIYHNISFKKLVSILMKSGVTMSTIMFIVGTVSMFSYILVRENIPQSLTILALKYISTPLLFLLVSNFIILIAGMFENGSAVILLLAPIFYPMVIQYNIDPIYFGVLMTSNLAIGMCTPPVAVTLYVASKVCNVSFDKITLKVIPFILVLILAQSVLIFFPKLVMILPNLVMN